MGESLGLFPLSTVLVPGAALRLHIFEDRYKELIGECLDRKEAFGVVLERHGRETGDALDPVAVGTAARIREAARLPEGRLFIVTRGIARFHIDAIVQREPYIRANVTYLPERIGSAPAAKALRETAAENFNEYLHSLLALLGRTIEDEIDLPQDAAASSYLIADTLQLKPPVKQRLLEIESADERLRLEIALMQAETRRLRAIRERKERGGAASDSGPFDVRFSNN
jgi:uncharacterized protein